MLTEETRKVLAVFMISRNNILVMHWKSSGIHFDVQHKICEDLLDKIDTMIDDIGEILVSLDNMALTLPEAMELAKNIPFIPGDRNIEFDEMVKLLNGILSKLVSGAKHLSEVAKKEIGDPNHISPIMDDMLAKLGKELFYLNRRRQ